MSSQHPAAVRAPAQSMCICFHLYVYLFSLRVYSCLCILSFQCPNTYMCPNTYTSCIDVYIHTYILLYRYVYTHTYIYIHIYISRSIVTLLRKATLLPPSLHTSLASITNFSTLPSVRHASKRRHTCEYARVVYICTYALDHVCPSFMHPCVEITYVLHINVWMCTRKCICIRMCMHTYICINAYVHAYSCIFRGRHFSLS
jgi:hypothetical protein